MRLPRTAKRRWKTITQQLYSHDNYRRMAAVYSVLRRLVPGRPSKILDMGCGDGSLYRGLEGYDVCGVDTSAAQIRKAGHIEGKVGNVENLPYRDGKFDFVVVSEVIEHVLEPDRLLSEARRVLKRGGRAVITTPNLGSFGKRLMLLLGLNPYIECSPFEKDAVGHIRYFVYGSLLQMVERHGFEVERFTSDVINFDKRGVIKSEFLAKIFPWLGRTLIFVLRKT